MIWSFTLIDVANVGTPIGEPIGWDEITWSAKRNIAHHGIFFNINTGNLSYVDQAFTLLADEYDLNGADGKMQLKIEYQCSPTDTVQTFFIGKFDFNTFKRTCGDFCEVQCQVIATNCVDKFLTAVDTDVALDTTTDLEGNSITPITEQTILLQGQNIVLNDKANNYDDVTFTDTNQFAVVGTHRAYAAVTLPNTTSADLGTFNENGNNTTLIQKGDGLIIDNEPTPISQADWDDYMQYTTILRPPTTGLNCIGAYIYSSEADGLITFTAQFDGDFTANLILKKYNLSTRVLTLITSAGGLAPTQAFTSGTPITVNYSANFSGSINLTSDEVLCYYFVYFVERTTGLGLLNYTITNNFSTVLPFQLNMFEVYQESSCEETSTKGYNVNSVFEFLPKVLSNDCFDITIGNYCLNDYSIANGLQIRNVLNPPPKLFTNWTDYFQNITKIFNIGWGFRDNETELVVDAIENFYSETVVVNVGSVNKIEFQNAQEFNYSLVNIGYSTWEAEEYSGLDEMNTSRQYRRNVSSFNKPIDLISNFIGAGYTIEITRRKNQALTGTSDWRYDDNIFIINTQNDEASTIAFRGVDSGAQYIQSPATRMNYMITPARNLMRWFKSLSMNPDYTNDEFIFSSGNGNYIAQGRMEQECSFEDESLSESQTIHSGNFIDQDNAKPLWKPLYMTFECPLTIAQQILISANPYGVIQANCNGTDYYGSIISCDYNPNEGTANFKLLQKIIYG